MFSAQRFAKDTFDEIQARQVMANFSGAPLRDEGGITGSVIVHNDEVNYA